MISQCIAIGTGVLSAPPVTINTIINTLTISNFVASSIVSPQTITFIISSVMNPPSIAPTSAFSFKLYQTSNLESLIQTYQGLSVTMIPSNIDITTVSITSDSLVAYESSVTYQVRF